jgi:hypothetical protein
MPVHFQVLPEKKVSLILGSDKLQVVPIDGVTQIPNFRSRFTFLPTFFAPKPLEIYVNMQMLKEMKLVGEECFFLQNAIRLITTFCCQTNTLIDIVNCRFVFERRENKSIQRFVVC